MIFQMAHEPEESSFLTSFCPFKLIISFPLGKPGIQDRHFISKSGTKSLYSLIGKGDLRDQYNGLLSFLNHLLDQFHVYKGLTAASHSMKQNSP